jgi:hypothetical protein
LLHSNAGVWLSEDINLLPMSLQPLNLHYPEGHDLHGPVDVNPTNAANTAAKSFLQNLDQNYTSDDDSGAFFWKLHGYWSKSCCQIWQPIRCACNCYESLGIASSGSHPGAHPGAAILLHPHVASLHSPAPPIGPATSLRHLPENSQTSPPKPVNWQNLQLA